jgi:hypothetical protein
MSMHFCVLTLLYNKAWIEGDMKQQCVFVLVLRIRDEYEVHGENE